MNFIDGFDTARGSLNENPRMGEIPAAQSG